VKETGAILTNRTDDEAVLFHATTIDKMFQIWKSGYLKPQFFYGSEYSSCPKGRNVIFTYKCRKRKICAPFEDHDIVLELTSGFFTEGLMTLTGNYQMPEYYVHESVPLDRCKIHADTKFLRYMVRIMDLGEEQHPYEVASEASFINWILKEVHPLNPLHGLFHPLGFRHSFSTTR
jgi:hypothetical protein